MTGFTYSYRKRWTHPVFNNLVEAAVWAWMCDMAAWKDYTKSTKHGPVEMKRGTLFVSTRFIADSFCMTHWKARNLMERLVQNNMIRPHTSPHTSLTKTAHLGTHFEIVNYDKYQCVTSIEEDKPDTSPHTSRTDSAHFAAQERSKSLKKENIEGGKPVITEKQVREIWNDIGGNAGLPLVRKIGTARMAHFNARNREEFCDDVESYKRFCHRVANSLFLTGGNDRRWVADFDFCMSPRGFNNILEGKYDNRRHTADGVKRNTKPKTNGAAKPQSDINSVLEGIIDV